MKQRILLSGANGLVGRNILEHPGKSDFEWLTPGSRELNLLDYPQVLNYFQKNKPDLVIHAAGRVGGIQANIREPVKFLLENLDMGRNIVWAARTVGVRRLINLGSSCMYPKSAVSPLREDMVLQGALEPTNEGYALAKITVARLCEYIATENTEYSYKTLIPCNIYGRFDKFAPEHSHLVPSIIYKLHMAKVKGLDSIDIWGDGTARREFMYAEDLADCIMEAVRRFDALPAAMNVGIGRDHSINEYYAIASEVIGWHGQFVHDLQKPVGMKQKLVSVARQTAWGWRAKTELPEGIAKTYDYYLKDAQS